MFEEAVFPSWSQHSLATVTFGLTLHSLPFAWQQGGIRHNLLHERTMTYNMFKIFQACLERHAKCVHSKIASCAGFAHNMSPRLKRYMKDPESALAKAYCMCEKH